MHNIAASDEFYGDYLGLHHEDLGLDWVTRYVTTSGQQLQLMTADDSGADTPVMSVAVDDVDAAFEEAVRRGYEIVHPLSDEPWGVRRFFVRTPGGHVVNIFLHRE
ncbi:MAG: VOC family protein [Propionibacteriaceae bacterium]|nr:VOC family protein [Propionibacteriaceae bacterium]